MTNPLRLHAALFASALALAGPLDLADDASAGEPMRQRGPLPASKSLTHTEARSINHVLGARLAEADWPQKLTDGDDATGLAAAQIAVRYAGAAEWTNEIELRYRGEGTVVVDLLRPHEKWIYDATRIALPASSEWATTVIAVAPDRYQGVTLHLESNPNRPVPEVSELGAYWFEEELMRDAAETADEWCEDYPGSGNDLSTPNETAQRFSDYLRDHGWTWKFDYGNGLAWEQDFKRQDLGGTNNSYADATDAIIYCGHGTTNATFMADTSHDDSAISSSDIDGAWGDLDLEWAWFHCCLNLSSTSWHHALNGAHTISGAINVINGSSNWGKTIAQKLIDNGIFDSAWSIYSAWWHSNDTNQPAGNQFRLLAEDQGHYNEHIWGQGTVLADSPDATHWTVSHTVSKAAGGSDVFDPEAAQPTSDAIDWRAPPSLGDPAQPALKVRVHPEVLQKALPQSAYMLDVLPSGLDDGVTAQFFERLCGSLQLDCGDLAVGREDASGYAAASGLACLSGDIASGGWQFTNEELHMVPEHEPDGIISPDEASERALSFLSGLDLLPQGNFFAGVRTLEAAEIGADDEIIQSFPFAFDVVVGHTFGPQGEALPVVGAGGRTHVSVGPDGSIQAFNQVSRQTQPRSAVDVISVASALDQLAAFGYLSLQTAPEFAAHTVEVRDANLGYFERSIGDPQQTIGPVYYLDVDLIGDDPQRDGAQISVAGRIYMAADTMPVHSHILAPGDGQSFEYGQNIAFRGDASDGTPPYQYRWYSDLHGLLSAQQNFSTDQLNPGFREDGSPAPITIELRVTDANGYEATDQIAIVITGIVGVEDIPAAFALAPNRPNPFNPRTTISFALPQAGHANLRILDLRGRLVRTLVTEDLPAGRHARIWDGTDTSGRPVASGVYLYRLDVDAQDGTHFTESQRMTLVR